MKHGAIKFETGWKDSVWKSKGSWSNGSEHSYDLIGVKPRVRKTVWLNVYKDGFGGVYNSRKKADNVFCHSRIACLQLDLDFEEGEGL